MRVKLLRTLGRDLALKAAGGDPELAAEMVEGSTADIADEEVFKELVKEGLVETGGEPDLTRAAPFTGSPPGTAQAAFDRAKAAMAPAVNYDALSVADLHAEATKRNLSGLAPTATKAEVMDALKEDDRAQRAETRKARAEGAESGAEPADYEAMSAADLHAEATKRNLEGRSGLTTKADLVKALQKDDRAQAKSKGK